VNIDSTKLQILSSKVLHILCILFFSLTLWNSLAFIYQNFGLRIKIIAVLFIILGMTILLAFIANRYLNKKHFIIFLIFIAFSVRFVWILNVNTPVFSDFAMMYHSAIEAAKGDFSFSQDNYFQNWVYQLGFTMYETLVIKIFGANIFILKLLNVFYSVGTTLMVYKITGKLFNDVSARISGLVYALFIPSIVMSSVLTNQHLATFLFYLGFYLIISHYSKRFIWIYIGILLALGDIIRPLGSLILLALGIFLFITQILGEDRRRKFAAVKKFIGIIAIYYLIHLAVSQLFISMDVTKYPLSNRDPLWKFVLGFNQETTGQYSKPDLVYVRQFDIGAERNDVEMKLIKERIADKQKVVVLFKEKLKIMWAENDASITWGAGHFKEPQLKERIRKLERLMYISILFFTLYSLISLLKTKHKNNLHLFFILLILGYAAVHLLVEIQTRYRYFIIPSFVILQGYGVYVVYMYFKGCFSRIWKKTEI
jgi:hypothetical protein